MLYQAIYGAIILLIAMDAGRMIAVQLGSMMCTGGVGKSPVLATTNYYVQLDKI